MLKGKGAQSNPANPFFKNSMSIEHLEGIDEFTHEEKPGVEVFEETTKNVISRNNSQDIWFEYSINPYQGCEHGCVYCYARNSHTYWGFSAGLDFESKIVVKKDVARQFERKISKSDWKVQPIMLSGNTDCYQPLERKYKLTRSLLEVALKYQHPIAIITKNSLILRDIDLLQELAKNSLVSVCLSITAMDEKLRSLLEPRTASYRRRLNTIEELSKNGIPVMVMNAPIIPGLNDHEMPLVIKSTAEAGARDIGYNVVRLNGQIGQLFEEWVRKAFPDRADKVLSQVKRVHGGHLNDSRWKMRLTGEGEFSTMIRELFLVTKKRYYDNRKMPPLNLNAFRRGGHYQLF
ncbi:PA0069 family radical SAM protein [Marinoscillum sp. MHG1-6]|uniref:PA0069 family radical SAM protein n=1 Tax=Marinoscillum sp. MHG1-6 TaxID=2959627 RepID=UPI00215700A9|nr:PA0069 family radical SAM protein [Marinoscillum sp. MHG1-6]